MNVGTKYLGLQLDNPLVVSASPMTRNVDVAKRLEDAGAGALVMHSLFQEEAIAESDRLDHYLNYFTEAFAEALTWYPDQPTYRLIPERYLEQVRSLKAALDIPVIASLNGISSGGWTQYAAALEEAGADALELNIYHIPTDLDVAGVAVEQQTLEVLRSVKAQATIPVSVKLSPYYSSIANMAKLLTDAGAAGLVLFNRFYQPDLDLDDLRVVPRLTFSTSADLRLPLRWVAILAGRLEVDFAVTGGVHGHVDALKALLAGADVAMMTSELLMHGVDRLREIRRDLEHWMEEREYASLDELRGSMGQAKVEDPTAYERANYIHVLQSWHPDPAGSLFREMIR